MTALRILLDRYLKRTDAIDARQQIEQFSDRDNYAAEDAWYAWLQAERAMRSTHPELALAWTRLAQRCLDEHPDSICDVELVSLYAHINDWLDEPRHALGAAREAWQRWSQFAESPLSADVTTSMGILFDVLSRPHPRPDLSEAELYFAWLHDRLAPMFEGSARRLMSLYGDLRAPHEAEAVAGAYAAWVERWTAQLQLGGPVAAAMLASMALTLGDVYDRCGDSARALAAFDEALDCVGPAASLPGTDETTARLRFNRANQLARLGRWAEAEAGYEQAAQELARLDDHEAVLRVRYAIAYLHHQQGAISGRLDELAALAADYEKQLQAARGASDEITARQGLDRAYRLWARVLASRLDTSDARDVQMFLLLVFALKEEEGKVAGFWRQLVDRPGAALHSEITVLVDRIRQRTGTVLLILEQAADALLIVTFRGGPGRWHEQVHVAIVEGDDVNAFERLIRVDQETVHALSDRVLPVTSEPDDEFVAACQRAWTVLPEQIRADLSTAETVLLNVDFQTDLDQFPVELLHDGETYLGLRAGVVQCPSLRDMNALLGENQVNAAATGTAVLVRSDDELVHADTEVEMIKGAVAALGAQARACRSPAPGELLDLLNDGADLLHYVGHGLADKIGEQLPLGTGKSLTARDVASLGPAPAPLTLLSACLAGRGRQLRTGEQQGFATALIGRGAPVVLAAKYLLPDHVSTRYWAFLYHFADESPIDQAALQTRRTLAAQGHHPAAWSCFALFGRPGVSIRTPHTQEASTWTSHVLRYLATGSAVRLTAARALLDDDDRLSRTQRDLIDADLSALEAGTAVRFGAERMERGYDLDEYAEARLVSSIVRAFGTLRTADAHPEEVVHDALGTLIAVDPLLCDTYLLLATVTEISRHLVTSVYQGEGRNLLARANRQVRWLTADDDLAAVRTEIEQIAERVRTSIFFDMSSIADVDAQTYREADTGDRAAQKRMLRNLLTRDADPRALLTPDWTPWLLRVIGAGTHQTLADALGAIDHAGSTQRINAAQHNTLIALIEQYVGPGAIDDGTAATAVAAFRDTEAAPAIDLFLLHDAVASGDTGVGLDRLRDGAQAADALGATGAAAYFRGVWAQLAANEDGLVDAAIDEATAALTAFESLRSTDPEYSGKHALTALLVAQLAAAAGRAELAEAATRTGVAAVDSELARTAVDRGGGLDDNGLASSAVRVLVLQGDVGGARALLQRVRDELDDDVRDELDRLVGPTPDFPADADAIGEHGSQRLHDDDLPAAVEWLGEARRRHEQSGRPERCCGLLGDLAVALRNLGNRAGAVRTYGEAIDLCRRVGDDVNLSRWSQNLALLQADIGERDEARTLMEEARQAAERSGNHYQLSTASGNLGHLHAGDGRYREALGALDDALTHADDPELKKVWRDNRVDVVGRWVDALIDANDVPRATQILHEANKAVPPADAEAKQATAWIWLRLAAADSERYRFRQATESITRAIDLFDETGDRQSASRAREALDQMRSRVRFVPESTDHDPATLRRRIDAAVAAHDVNAELDARTDLALGLLQSGSAEAPDVLNTALARAASAGSRRHELNLTVNAAPYLLAGGDPHGALALARRAQEIAGDEPSPFSVAAQLHLAQAWDEGFGDQQQALEHYRQAHHTLAALLDAAPAQARRIVDAKRGLLLRGVQLATQLSNAADGLRMWGVWDPEAARQLADAAPAPLSLEHLAAEQDHELDTVLAAWRAAASPGPKPTEDDLAGSALSAMRRLAEIVGWRQATARLDRVQVPPDPPPASRGGPAGVLWLAQAVTEHAAAFKDAVRLTRQLAVSDDDLTCLVLYTLAMAHARTAGTANILMRLVAETATESRLVARVLNLQAIFEPDPQRKLHLYERAANRLHDGSDEVQRAYLLVEQAGVLLELGQPAEARDRAEAAIPIADKAGDPKIAANARGNIALARMNLGEFAEALHAFESLVDVPRTNGDERGLEATLTNIAVCRMQLGDTAGAAFTPTTHDPVNLFNEAQRQGLLGRYDTAVDLFEEAIAATRTRPDPRISEALILTKYARTLINAGRIDEAVNRMLRAAQLAHASGEKDLEEEASTWLNQIADLYRQM